MTTFESTNVCVTCGHLYVEHWDNTYGWVSCQHINVLGRECPCKGFLYEPIKRTYTVTVELSEGTLFMLDGIQAQSWAEDDRMNITVLVSEAMALRDEARIERDRHRLQGFRFYDEPPAPIEGVGGAHMRYLEAWVELSALVASWPRTPPTDETPTSERQKD